MDYKKKYLKYKKKYLELKKQFGGRNKKKKNLDNIYIPSFKDIEREIENNKNLIEDIRENKLPMIQVEYDEWYNNEKKKIHELQSLASKLDQLDIFSYKDLIIKIDSYKKGIEDKKSKLIDDKEALNNEIQHLTNNQNLNGAIIGFLIVAAVKGEIIEGDEFYELLKNAYRHKEFKHGSRFWKTVRNVINKLLGTEINFNTVRRDPLKYVEFIKSKVIPNSGLKNRWDFYTNENQIPIWFNTSKKKKNLESQNIFKKDLMKIKDQKNQKKMDMWEFKRKDDGKLSYVYKGETKPKLKSKFLDLENTNFKPEIRDYNKSVEKDDVYMESRRFNNTLAIKKYEKKNGSDEFERGEYVDFFKDGIMQKGIIYEKFFYDVRESFKYNVGYSTDDRKEYLELYGRAKAVCQHEIKEKKIKKQNSYGMDYYTTIYEERNPEEIEVIKYIHKISDDEKEKRKKEHMEERSKHDTIKEARKLIDKLYFCVIYEYPLDPEFDPEKCRLEGNMSGVRAEGREKMYKWLEKEQEEIMKLLTRGVSKEEISRAVLTRTADYLRRSYEQELGDKAYFYVEDYTDYGFNITRFDLGEPIEGLEKYLNQ